MNADADIRHELESELHWNPRVDERAIDIEVSGAIVHLRGEVAECIEVYAAADTALRIIGVKALDNPLDVTRAGRRSGADIEYAASNTFG